MCNLLFERVSAARFRLPSRGQRAAGRRHARVPAWLTEHDLAWAAEKVHQAISADLSRMSHELRTPLNPILEATIAPLDGAIGVHSTLGIGTVFWIALRSTRVSTLTSGNEACGHPIALHAGASCAAPPPLLYVENNPAILKLVEEFVRWRADLRLWSAPAAHPGIEFMRAYVVERHRNKRQEIP